MRRGNAAVEQSTTREVLKIAIPGPRIGLCSCRHGPAPAFPRLPPPSPAFAGAGSGAGSGAGIDPVIGRNLCASQLGGLTMKARDKVMKA